MIKKNKELFVKPSNQDDIRVSLDNLISVSTDINKKHGVLKDYIKNMDMDELGVSVFPTNAEWSSILVYRSNDITKEIVLRCELPIVCHMDLFTLDEFLENTTSKHLYDILSRYTKSDVLKAIEYYKDTNKLDIDNILYNTKYLPYDVIINYWEYIKYSEDALQSLCSNLFVPNAFFIEHKELFWDYRWDIGRRCLLDNKITRAFKLVPYKYMPEEHKIFRIVDSSDNNFTTKEALKLLKNTTLPLECQ